MGASKEKVLNFMEHFQTAYFINRDVDAVLEMLSADIKWKGIHEEEHCKGREEARHMFRIVNRKVTSTFKLVLVSNAMQEVKPNIFVMQETIHLHEETFDHKIHDIMLSLTGVCIYSKRKYYLRELDYSILGDEPFMSDFFLEGYSREDQRVLKKIINRQTQELERKKDELNTLTNNVPGGIFSCLFDEKLTILQMSEGFLSLVGYTRKEIEEQFHNSFYAMIHEEDRASSLREVLAQLALGNAKRLEYRIMHKDGYPIWVLDRGQFLVDEQNVESFYCILLDITQDKKTQESLHLSLERYKIIMDQTNDIIFEWDILQDHLSLSQNWEKKFGYRPKTKNNHVSLFDGERMTFHAHDFISMKNMLADVRSGSPYVETEVRIKHIDRRYVWCRFRITTQFNPAGVPIKAIGVIIDIDREKKESEDLLKKAEQDALTGMYNKITSQSVIRNYLSNSPRNEMCALLIIDIDNFKTVNDTCGHLYGDAVLAEIAREIKKTFRKSDIIGRIGGDEFIIFIKDIQQVAIAEQGAAKLIQAIHNLKVNGEREYELSCSIGISIYPQDGALLSELYRNSDHALYQAKNIGKNCFVLYDEQVMNDSLFNLCDSGCSVISDKIDSNEITKVFNGKLIEYVFRILYKSVDMEKAVQTILEIIGMQFDVSRTYIFENIENDEYCCNTFEWCNTGESPEIQNLRHVSYEHDLGGNYWDNFNEEGIFYCRDIMDLPKKQYDILAPQGIKSMLQCAISSNGVLKGYVGFDECRQNRYWTQEQIDSLVFIAEILSIFLLKKRAEEQFIQERDGLLAILDNQNAWIYVIDPKDYTMLFVNKKTLERVPNSKVGMRCHEAFLDRKDRCENCPAVHVNKTCPNFTTEFYNETLDLWTNADASYITWKGEDAILLACHDIGKFKRN